VWRVHKCCVSTTHSYLFLDSETHVNNILAQCYSWFKHPGNFKIQTHIDIDHTVLYVMLKDCKKDSFGFNLKLLHSVEWM